MLTDLITGNTEAGCSATWTPDTKTFEATNSESGASIKLSVDDAVATLTVSYGNGAHVQEVELQGAGASYIIGAVQEATDDAAAALAVQDMLQAIIKVGGV